MTHKEEFLELLRKFGVAVIVNTQVYENHDIVYIANVLNDSGYGNTIVNPEYLDEEEENKYGGEPLRFCSKVQGYSDFYAMFVFNKDGSFKEIELGE